MANVPIDIASIFGPTNAFTTTYTARTALGAAAAAAAAIVGMPGGAGGPPGFVFGQEYNGQIGRVDMRSPATTWYDLWKLEGYPAHPLLDALQAFSFTETLYGPDGELQTVKHTFNAFVQELQGNHEMATRLQYRWHPAIAAIPISELGRPLGRSGWAKTNGRIGCIRCKETLANAEGQVRRAAPRVPRL